MNLLALPTFVNQTFSLEPLTIKVNIVLSDFVAGMIVGGVIGAVVIFGILWRSKK